MSLSLCLDLYELTMAQGYFIYKTKNRASFDLFVREMPRCRSYLVAAGLQDVLHYVQGLKFSSADLEYLRGLKIFHDDFLRYLANFRFRGDIWAMPEGEIFFPNEPVLRVTANIIEAQIIESFLLNTVNLQSMLASKASRVVNAAAGRQIFDFSLRRAPGIDAGIKVARSAYIVGAMGSSCVLAGKLYKIPVAGTMAHSFVMSFKKEIESFLAYAETFGNKSILIVDTYDSKKGIENAVLTALYLKEKGHSLLGIRLDSADIAAWSKFARRRLDQAGLKEVKIFASGNLDEFKISALLKRGAAVDVFGVGTHMGTSSDAPSLDVVYKLSEASDENGRFFPTMKLSRDKVTLPGRKQVFRAIGKNGRFAGDVIALETERIKGRPLLSKVMGSGKVVREGPSLKEIRERFKRNLDLFPAGLRSISLRQRYPVVISPGLKRMIFNLKRNLKVSQ